MSEPTEIWSPEWTRAALSLALLSLLIRESTHGYQLLANLRAEGFSTANGGTVYPLLSRLEDAGFVRHEWNAEGSGPARKIFSITDAGCDEHKRLFAGFSAFSAALKNLVKVDG